MPSKPVRRRRGPSKPPPSPNEMALDRVTSRAANTYARIDIDMRKAMGLLKHGMKKHNANSFSEARRVVQNAIGLVDSLKRDLFQTWTLIGQIGMEPQNPIGPQASGPRLLEV